jgi:hypothetical protein
MQFNIIYPFTQIINGDTLNEAIKTFVKLNYDINLTKLIIQDQNKYYDTKIKYYVHDGRNKIGINMFPTNQYLLHI